MGMVSARYQVRPVNIGDAKSISSRGDEVIEHLEIAEMVSLFQDDPTATLIRI
mgnify:CR=1 FL=1